MEVGGVDEKNISFWMKCFKIIHEGSEVFRMIGSLVLSTAWWLHPRDFSRKFAYCTVNPAPGSNSDSHVVRGSRTVW